MLLGIAVIGALIGYLAFLNTTTTTTTTTTSVNAILDFLLNTPLEYCEWDDQETVFHPTVKSDQELVLDYLDKTNQFSFEKFGRKMFYENL